MSINKAVFYNDFIASDKTSSEKKSDLAGTRVIIESYNPAYHTLKVVREEDGKPLIAARTTSTDLNKSMPFEQSRSKSIKTLPSPKGAIMEVNDDIASIRGSSDNGFYSSGDFANIVKGPISFSAEPHEVRVSGLMNLHPLLMSGFPSTIVTPIPTFQWSLPSGAMLGPIARDVAMMATLVGALA